MMADDKRDLQQEIEHACAFIKELGLQESPAYFGNLKREDKIRDLLIELRVEVPDAFILDVLARTEARQDASDEPQSVTDELGVTFVYIPAGEFCMGTSAEQVDMLIERYPDVPRMIFEPETPEHRVTISQPFELAVHQVTQAQWEAVMGTNPSRFRNKPTHPVERVSWEDVQAFLQRLNARHDGYTYYLPSEAQWEYTCRAGSPSTYYYGDDELLLGDYAWYSDNADNSTHPVG